ncbi:MAG: BrnT family toxin [Acinetobacter sp.]|nr:BrnT family toxin [Acinetobacter sp.]
MVNFSWDEAKARSNYEKHGVSFETALLVFQDEYALQKQDRIENGEMRWQTVGMIANVATLLVAHTWYDDCGDEHIRIISARKATKGERKIYEQHRYQNY